MGLTLRSNELYASLSNLILGTKVAADRIANVNNTMAEKSKVAVGKFGDVYRVVSNDCINSQPWTGDDMSNNLLAVHRAPDPNVQNFYVDQFRYVPLTTSEFIECRAWNDEGSFAEFQSSLMSLLGDSRKVYDTCRYNAYFGTETSTATKGVIDVEIATATTGLTGNEKLEVTAKEISKAIADVAYDLTEPSTDYNNLGYLRSYDKSAVKVLFNQKWASIITKTSLPTIYHDNFMQSMENVLPAKYFGSRVTLASATADTTNFTVSGNNITLKAASTLAVRSMIETDYTVSGTTTHVRPGDLIPKGATFTATKVLPIAGKSGINTNNTYPVVDVAYVEDGDVICKIFVDDTTIPQLTSASFNTSFFNALTMNTNHYLIWGLSTLDARDDLPFITLMAD